LDLFLSNRWELKHSRYWYSKGSGANILSSCLRDRHPGRTARSSASIGIDWEKNDQEFEAATGAIGSRHSATIAM